jgi:hypothetical protein
MRLSEQVGYIFHYIVFWRKPLLIQVKDPSYNNLLFKGIEIPRIRNGFYMGTDSVTSSSECLPRHCIELCSLSDTKLWVNFKSLKSKLYLGFSLNSRYCVIMEIFMV